MLDLHKLSTVHLSTAHSWRGGENQLLLLTKGLAAHGHRVLILAPKDAPLLERAREEGLPTRTLTLRGELDPVGTWRLARLLRKLKPDVLHLHDGHAVLPGQWAARALPRARLAVIAHRRTAFRLRGRWKFGGRVDKVVAISAAVREKVLEAGLASERVAVVYSGLEFPEPFSKSGPEAQSLRKELGLKPGAHLIAHAAALTAEKRQSDLIEALARKPATENMHLALAGSGALEAALKSQVRSLGLEARVHFLGFHRDLRPLWAAADWAAFSSEAEGLCTALIEAQGAGLPAVVTRAGGMPEVVQEGKTGLVTPIGDVRALAVAFRRLAQSSEERETLGRAAHKRARALFSAEALVQNTLKVYRAERP